MELPIALKLWYVLYIVGVATVVGIGSVVAGILYQYLTFNSHPAGTRALPSPKGRLPLVGHRHLLTAVQISFWPMLTCRAL